MNNRAIVDYFNRVNPIYPTRVHEKILLDYKIKVVHASLSTDGLGIRVITRNVDRGLYYWIYSNGIFQLDSEGCQAWEKENPGWFAIHADPIDVMEEIAKFVHCSNEQRGHQELL
jgi:hypothetical protein